MSFHAYLYYFYSSMGMFSILSFCLRITLLPEHHYPYLQDKIDSGATYYSRDLPYSLDFLLENFMDPAHIPFAHHSLQGDDFCLLLITKLLF